MHSNQNMVGREVHVISSDVQQNFLEISSHLEPLHEGNSSPQLTTDSQVGQLV